MENIRQFSSRTVVLPADNIDTDQIIPARFLKVTTRHGLGKVLFSDWRYDAQGKPRPEFILNRPEAEGCRILVAGDNFGCGSSREHAPWALTDYGFRAIVSTSIADIFRNNALKNGLLPIAIPIEAHRALVAAPGAEVTVDLDRCTLSLPGGGEVAFSVDTFSRFCLMNGVDELGYLQKQESAIAAYEANRNVAAPEAY